jgi:hypothetical protein
VQAVLGDGGGGGERGKRCILVPVTGMPPLEADHKGGIDKNGHLVEVERNRAFWLALPRRTVTGWASSRCKL